MKKQNLKSFQILLLSMIVLLISTTAFAPLPALSDAIEADPTEAISSGVDYLGTQMNDDGGIRWFDESSSPAATIKVVQALAALGYEGDYIQSESGNSPLALLKTEGFDWVNQEETDSPAFNVARAGQLLTAIAAANENPQAFGPEEVDLVYPIITGFDPNTGVYGSATSENVTDQVWAMLGLAANAFSIPPEAAIWLAAAQADDGSWDDGYGSTLDTTPLAMMALIASGNMTADSAEIQTAIDFLVNQQHPDGGWQSAWDTTTNANTTGVILQAISALGQSPMDYPWQNLDGNPQTALLAIQEENGAFGGDYANAYSTADAVLTLSGQTPYNLGYLYKADLSFDYVLSQQASDGGWGSMGQTLDVFLALSAAGWEPDSVTLFGRSPMEYVEENLAGYIESGPDAVGKAILGLSAAGYDPAVFAGVDLITALNATYDDGTGTFGMADNTWHQAYAILGLNAAGEPIPSEAVDSLIMLQQEDGGWEYAAGFGSWPDNTALALQALLAVGESQESTAVQNGLRYLQNTLTETGGWGDSSTTAFALMALNALDIPNADWKNESGLTPLSELFTYQKANGAFVYNWEYTDDNLMATTSALLALFGGDLVVSPSESGAPFAGLVIDPGDDDATLVCVPFEGDTMTGMDLLNASGIPHDAPEGFVESIMDISNPDGGTFYWSYWTWNGQAWAFSMAGAGDSTVFPGSIEAWHFTSWEVFPSLPPDVAPNLNEMCSASVLKNYAVQPFLNYDDLFSKSSGYPQELIPIQETAEEVPTPSENESELSLETTPESETAAPSLLLQPTIIIGVVGLIVVIVVVVLVSKKRA